jgi:integrase
MHEFVNLLYGRPKTIRAYKSLFINHIEPHITDKEAAEFTQKDLDSLAQIWISKGLKSATLNSIMCVLRQYLDWCGADMTKINTKSVTQKLKRLEQEPEHSCLTKEEAEKFLTVAQKRGKKIYLFCLLGFHAGLRRGEILGLKWRDFDAINNRINIRRTYRNQPTKNGKNRQVPISEDLENALEEAGYTMKKSDNFVFKTIIHHPNPILASISEEAGVPHITTHTMRHTFATLALENGVSPKTVQLWLGHENLGTTLNYYWKSIPYENRLEFLPKVQSS